MPTMNAKSSLSKISTISP